MVSAPKGFFCGRCVLVNNTIFILLMQRRFLLICMLFVGLTIMAKEVSEQEAKQKALSFMQANNGMRAKGMSMAYKAPKLSMVTAAAGNAFYVFKNDGGKGFVVVAGDDRARTILGYSDDAVFDADNIPDGLQAMFEGYVKQISALKATDVAADVKTRVSTAVSDVTPLVTAKWDQGTSPLDAHNPFNATCPMEGSSYTVTGCVATAMAQVMYYHKFPTTSVTTDAYIVGGKNYPALPSYTFDWANMIDDYSSGTATSDQITAVAKLMQYCGHAVRMEYGVDASAASDHYALQAFKRFGYNVNASIRSNKNYSIDGWEDLIYNEVSSNRPVFYSALNSDGGHAFVVDGYKSDGNLFHVNWGWGGVADGYYSIYALAPSYSGTGGTTDPYCIEMGAIIGLSTTTMAVEPEGTYNFATSSDLSILSVEGVSPAMVSVPATMNATVKNLHASKDFKGYVYLAACSDATTFSSWLDSIYVVLKAGESKTIPIHAMYSVPGEKYMRVSATYSEDGNVAGVYGSINVSAISTGDVGVTNNVSDVTFTGGWGHVSEKLSGYFTVTNSSSEVYTNQFTTALLVADKTTGMGSYSSETYVDTLVQIPAGGSAQIRFSYAVSDESKMYGVLLMKLDGGGHQFVFEQTDPYLLNPASGIKAVMATDKSDTKADGIIYSLSGQNMGTDFSALPPGIYIRNGKKIIK